MPHSLILDCVIQNKNLPLVIMKTFTCPIHQQSETARINAKEAAEAIETFLSNKNAQARDSFEEAGEELLELFRLNVPNTLNVSLLSTNCIENAFKNLRRHIGGCADGEKKPARQTCGWQAG